MLIISIKFLQHSHYNNFDHIHHWTENHHISAVSQPRCRSVHNFKSASHQVHSEKYSVKSTLFLAYPKLVGLIANYYFFKNKTEKLQNSITKVGESIVKIDVSPLIATDSSRMQYFSWNFINNFFYFSHTSSEIVSCIRKGKGKKERERESENLSKKSTTWRGYIRPM